VVLEVLVYLQVGVVAFRQVGVAYRRVGVVAFRQVGEAYRRVGVVAFHQVAGAAFHQLAEAVALHRVVVVFLDQAAAQLQN
jgi:hypothetical protein